MGVVVRAVRGDRERWVEELLGRLDFRPGAIVSWHGDGRTVPESYADALSAWGGAPARWVLQFEDDAVLAPDFADHALRLLRQADARPNVGLVSFYSGRRVREGEAIPGEPTLEYLPGARFLMAQAIAMRAASIADHNDFLLRWTAERGRPYATDPATAAWLAARGLKYGRSWPGIVQHRDVPSLYGHRRNPNRFSASYDLRYGVRSF